MIADLIRTALSNWLVVLLLIAGVTSFRRIRRARMARRPFSASYIVWGELLFYIYGIGAIYTGVLHAYFSAMVAATIGWAPSPFQYELGWMEIGVGVVALIAGPRGYGFRLAATLPYTIFLLAAAAQHIHLLLTQHDMSPGNAGLVLWLGDIAIPLAMLILTRIAREEV